ncbi:MAG: MFS transporter [Clostridia bacterium]|nr:MFS transporter [Clostridia bacterium]
MESQKVSNKLKWGYAFGGIGKDMCYALVSNFLMYYCTENLGVSALFMGILFFFARLWDAINDPIMGTFVDNTRTRFGRYKFWMMIGTLANVVAVIFLFNPYFASRAPRVYIGVFYVVWGMTYTMVDVPYWAFNSNVSDDRKERESVSTLARLLTSLGALATQVLTPIVIVKLGYDAATDSVHNEKGYFIWAIIVSAAFVLTMLVASFTIKERSYISEKKEKIALKEAFKVLTKNDQLVIAVIVFILINIAQNLALGSALYYFKYVWGDEQLYSKFVIVLGASIGIGLLSFPLLSKVLYKRSGRLGHLLLALGSPIVGFLLMFISNNFIFASASENVRFYVCCGIGLVSLIGFGSVTILLTLIMSDCVDYGEYIFGKRTENIVFSMQTFLVKFAGAISFLIIGVSMHISGYEGSMFDSNAVSMAVVPNSLIAVLNVLMFILPPLFLLAGAILFATKYKLAKKGKMEEIREELQKRRAAAAEGGSDS